MPFELLNIWFHELLIPNDKISQFSANQNKSFLFVWCCFFHQNIDKKNSLLEIWNSESVKTYSEELKVS